MSEKPRCRLCYEPTTAVFNIKFKAINVCDHCALWITKQEVQSWQVRHTTARGSLTEDRVNPFACPICGEPTDNGHDREYQPNPYVCSKCESRGNRMTINMNLTERRAEFVYEGARIAAIAAKAPIIPEPWTDREAEFRGQFVEVIERQCGTMRSSSPAELHGDWVQAYIDMGWIYGPVRCKKKKTHPDMVPYEKLGQLEQDKDAVFVSLCEIARQWIYDLDSTAIKDQ